MHGCLQTNWDLTLTVSASGKIFMAHTKNINFYQWSVPFHHFSLNLSNLSSKVPHCLNTKRIPTRSSHRRCSVKKGVLRNFTKFTGKHLCQSLFFNSVASLRPATLLKKGLWHRCFPVNFVKFPRTPYLQNTTERLLLFK